MSESTASTPAPKKIAKPKPKSKPAAKPVVAAKSKPAPKAKVAKPANDKPKSFIVKHKYGIQELAAETGFVQPKVRALLRSMKIPKNGSRYGWDNKADFDPVVKQLKLGNTFSSGGPKPGEPKPKKPGPKSKSVAKPMPVDPVEETNENSEAEAVPDPVPVNGSGIEAEGDEVSEIEDAE